MGEEREGAAARRPAAKRVAATRAGTKRKKIVRTCWSAKREAAFLETLGQTSCVAKAARAAGVSDTTVYRRRQRYAAFRAAWIEALREGYVKLETEMLARALNGVRKPIFQGGKQVGETTEYDNRLALALLAAHGKTVHGGPGEAPAMSDEGLREALAMRTAEMNRRMGGEG